MIWLYLELQERFAEYGEEDRFTVEEINKYYHQASDEADSLDYEYLVKFYQGYVLSGRLIANDPEKPFWIKGDKYEAAGNVLYGKTPKAPIKN